MTHDVTYTVRYTFIALVKKQHTRIDSLALHSQLEPYSLLSCAQTFQKLSRGYSTSSNVIIYIA